METFFSFFEELFKNYGSILDPAALVATSYALISLTRWFSREKK